MFLAFDKAFALLEAFAIVYVARPAAIASARTLLQATPGSSRALESTFTLPEVSCFGRCLRVLYFSRTRTLFVQLPAEKARMTHLWAVGQSDPVNVHLVAEAKVTLRPAATDSQLLEATAHVKEYVLLRLSPSCPVIDLCVDVDRGG